MSKLGHYQVPHAICIVLTSPLFVRRTLLAKYDVVNSNKAIYDHPIRGIVFGDITSFFGEHDLEMLPVGYGRRVYSELSNYRREDGEPSSTYELTGDDDWGTCPPAKADVEVFTV